MDKNIRIAMELVRIARGLVAGNNAGETFFDSIKKDYKTLMNLYNQYDNFVGEGKMLNNDDVPSKEELKEYIDEMEELAKHADELRALSNNMKKLSGE